MSWLIASMMLTDDVVVSPTLSHATSGTPVAVVTRSAAPAQNDAVWPTDVEIPNQGTEREKFERVYQWVAKNIAYDEDTLFTINTAVRPQDVLARGRAVCGGISTLTVELAKRVGLDARVVTGLAKDWDPATFSFGFIPHAWVEVKIDGTPYWSDPSDGVELIHRGGKVQNRRPRRLLPPPLASPKQYETTLWPYPRGVSQEEFRRARAEYLRLPRIAPAAAVQGMDHDEWGWRPLTEGPLKGHLALEVQAQPGLVLRGAAQAQGEPEQSESLIALPHAEPGRWTLVFAPQKPGWHRLVVRAMSEETWASRAKLDRVVESTLFEKRQFVSPFGLKRPLLPPTTTGAQFGLRIWQGPPGPRYEPGPHRVSVTVRPGALPPEVKLVLYHGKVEEVMRFASKRWQRLREYLNPTRTELELKDGKWEGVIDGLADMAILAAEEEEDVYFHLAIWTSQRYEAASAASKASWVLRPAR